MKEHEITGLISGIKRMEIHDGDGLRTTVFFKGCPLRCIWCHNPESISYEPQLAVFDEKCIKCGTCSSVCPNDAISPILQGTSVLRDKCIGCFTCGEECPSGALVGYGTVYTVDEMYRKVMIDVPFFAGGNGGVTLSGGECLTQPDFAVSLAKKLFESGISVDIDTCGYVKREVFERIMRFTDTFLFDVKAVDPEIHRRCTGRDNQTILDNLRFLCSNGCRVEIRYPLVVGFNDGECERLAELLAGMNGIVGVKVLRYHNYAASRYTALGMSDTLPPPLTTDEAVEGAREVFVRHGIRVLI